MEKTPEIGYIPQEEKISPEPENELARETEEGQVDMNQAAEGAADDIVKELNPDNDFESIRSSDNQHTLSQKISDGIKEFWQQSSVGAAFGFVGVSAARIAIKQSALLYLGGSLGAGAVAGAVAGAAIEGVRTYVRERKKFSAEDIISQLDSAPDSLQKAAIVAKAEKNLKEARINNSPEANDLVDIVRAARLHLETESEKDELKGKSEAQQIRWLLNASGRNIKEIPRVEKRNARLLLKEIEFKSEKSDVDFNKVGRAVLRGGLVGALGGAVGGALSHYVFDSLHPGQWLEHTVKPIQESMPGISRSQAEAIAERTLQQKSEAAAAAAARVFAEGKNRLLQDRFTAVAEHGDGWTNLARKAVHDYLVNLRELSPDSAPNLSPEQLVHIEDTLVKEQLHSGAKELIQLGQELELTGAKIQMLIERAQDLSPEKIQNISNILQTSEHHLSSATTSWMADYGHVSNPGNDFARAIADRAQEAAKLAASAVQEIAIPETADKVSPETPEALDKTATPQVPAAEEEAPDKTSFYVKSILAVLGAGALAGYAAKKIFFGRRAETKEPKIEKPVSKMPSIEKSVEEPVAPSAKPLPVPSEVPPIPIVLPVPAPIPLPSREQQQVPDEDGINNEQINMENINETEPNQEPVDKPKEQEILKHKEEPSVPDIPPVVEEQKLPVIPETQESQEPSAPDVVSPAEPETIPSATEEQTPPVAPKAPTPTTLPTPTAPVAPSSPKTPEIIPPAGTASEQKQTREIFKAVENFTEVLQERYPNTAAKLTEAIGWTELNPETQNFISAGLLRLLDVNHWIEKDLDKYNKFVFNIKATQEELNHPEYIWIEDIKSNKTGALEIFIKFDDTKGTEHGFNFTTGNPFDLSHLRGEIIKWNEALSLYDLYYSREWTRGRANELADRFTKFFAKITNAENWDQLDEETKDNLADAFLAYFDLYPQYVNKTQNDNRRYVIELDDKIKKEMKSGKLIILKEVSIDSDGIVKLMLGSEDKKDWRYGDRTGYLSGSASITSSLDGL